MSLVSADAARLTGPAAFNVTAYGRTGGYMKLRDRLLLFSTAQLVMFGAAFALAYGAFAHSVLPMFEDLLRAKTEQAARSVGAELEVPLGADDPALIARAVEHVVNEHDFAYLVVRDARDRRVFARGALPPGPAFAGTESHARLGDGASAAWLTISVEGLRLGSAAIGFSTVRLDALATWARRSAVGVMLMWLTALIYSLGFARSLRDHLNQMTSELEHRGAERDAAAARASELRDELLSVTRMAGMAEIATGVLHNVGNVLNSLNVSVMTISDHVRGSRVAGLTRSIELVDSFPGGLPAFLDTEKGKVLPTYLSTVSKHLAEENARMLDELDSVNRNVEHIKSIVAMQQSYARPTGLREPVALAELIDDALNMGDLSLARQGIEVITDYTGELALVTDRHKLLQIMINLISNARHALNERGAPPQQLTVRVRTTATELTIAVTDTGVGIPTENLEKIFRHGFTTKPGGHGFGLHASANAARELGGRLRADSAGPDRGATFTLELPRFADEGAHDQRN
jgi:signal transduction histidine kinase